MYNQEQKESFIGEYLRSKVIAEKMYKSKSHFLKKDQING